MFGGVEISFYDRTAVTHEFGEAGLIEVADVAENYPFYYIVCRKEDAGAE